MFFMRDVSRYWYRVLRAQVEKLKAHEHNILQLLKKGEAEEAMSRVSQWASEG